VPERKTNVELKDIIYWRALKFFCEVPLGTTENERKILRKSQNTNLKLQINHNSQKTNFKRENSEPKNPISSFQFPISSFEIKTPKYSTAPPLTNYNLFSYIKSTQGRGTDGKGMEK